MMTTTSRAARLDPALRASLASSLRELFATTTGPDLTAALADLGWAEVEAEDPATATSLLFRAHGNSLASSTLLSDTLLRSFGPGFPFTGNDASLLLPHAADDASRPGAQQNSGARGILLGTPAPGTLVLVPVCRGYRVMLHPVEAEWVLDRCTPAAGFDASSDWLHFSTGDYLPDPPATAPSVGVDWVTAVGLGRRALASEILGVCDSALRLASDHVTSRHQYGRAIGSFQAVRHQLSEAHVAVEAASSLLESVWSGITDESHFETPPEWAAAAAKARAGRAQSVVMRTGVQVLGAMGLTEESAMHRYVARAAALDLLLGGQARLEESLGTHLLDGTAAYPIASIFI